MRLIVAILGLFCTSICIGQSGFKTQIALEADEPNQGFHVLEDTANTDGRGL